MFRLVLMVLTVAATARCLAGPAAAAAQESTTVEAAGTFFALSVKDVDVSARWYAETFGLTIGRRSTAGDATSVLLSGKGLEVELIAFHESTLRPSPFGAGSHERGIVKVGFVVANFEQALARLRARDVDVALGPFPARKGQRTNVLIRDPEGNLIQLFGGFAK